MLSQLSCIGDAHKPITTVQPSTRVLCTNSFSISCKKRVAPRLNLPVQAPLMLNYHKKPHGCMFPFWVNTFLLGGTRACANEPWSKLRQLHLAATPLTKAQTDACRRACTVQSRFGAQYAAHTRTGLLVCCPRCLQ